LSDDLNIYADKTDPGGIRLIGTLDGVDGSCMGSDNFDQVFAIQGTDTQRAINILRVGTLVVEFSAVMNTGFTEVAFANTFLPCPSTAVRNANKDLPTEPALPDITDLNVTYSADETLRLQNLWYGSFESTASCVPSTECCCTTQSFLIEEFTNQNSTDGLGISELNPASTIVYMKTNLDGGIACLRRTGKCVHTFSSFCIVVVGIIICVCVFMCVSVSIYRARRPMRDHRREERGVQGRQYGVPRQNEGPEHLWERRDAHHRDLQLSVHRGLRVRHH
jgi:hypothetical protein